jgi:hypothetical protein
MATSGTYTYSATVATVIEEALKKIGVIEEGVSASSTQISDAMPVLEMYLKAMSNKGLQIWKVIKTSKTTVAATAGYIPSATFRYQEITGIVFRDSDGNDTPLIELTRDEYDRINDKDLGSTPSQYWWDKESTVGSDYVYLWPVPDSTAAGNSEAVIITGIVPIQDADNDGTDDGTYDIDVPAEYLEAVVYGLAVRLAPAYGLPVSDRRELRSEYKDIMDDALNFDRETGSLYIKPSRQGGW